MKLLWLSPIVSNCLIVHTIYCNYCLRYGAFNEKVLLNYTQQILLAIDYMHTNRFLHRFVMIIKSESYSMILSGLLKLI